jgi:glyoxylase-like metal-dependent hydrolase (beta-lactamase superfamily II)/rhodanese-related sulfurtransferase
MRVEPTGAAPTAAEPTCAEPLVQSFVDARRGCAAYLLACPATREAAVVDPGPDPAPIEAAIEARGLRLRYVVDTHVHADHVSGARALAAAHAGRGASLCLHAVAPVAFPFRVLRDGAALPLGTLRLRVLHRPGHRPEQVGLLVAGPGRGAPRCVLTADALLAGDVGHPEGPGGDAAAAARSLARLLALPGALAVHPAHVANGLTTTVGAERRGNPWARLRHDEGAFAAALRREPPARPPDARAIEATNRGLEELAWATLAAAPELPQLTLAALERECDAAARGGVLLLDVREPAEFARGHVPGAVNAPRGELARVLAALPRDRRVATIDSGVEGEWRALHAARLLRRRGLREVMVVGGGTLAWALSGRALARGR